MISKGSGRSEKCIYAADEGRKELKRRKEEGKGGKGTNCSDLSYSGCKVVLVD